MIKKLLAAGHLVVGEGKTSALGSSYPLLVAMRGGRSGIALQPDQLDGNLLRVQFPRLRRADFPPGRSLFVSRGSHRWCSRLRSRRRCNGGALPIAPIHRGAIQ